MNTNKLPANLPPHPGVVLAELMRKHHLTAYRVAKDIGASAITISQIIRGARRVSPLMALRLGRYFDADELASYASEWYLQQTNYDLALSRATHDERIAKQVTPLAAQ